MAAGDTCRFGEHCARRHCSEDFCLRKYKLMVLFSKSGLDEAYWKKIPLFPDKDGTDLDKFKELSRIASDITGFVAGRKNLYIHSNTCGNGKTSWAIRLMQEYLYKIWPYASTDTHALFIDVPRFLLSARDNIDSDDPYAPFILESLPKAELVVWDDIGAKIGTDFELNRLLGMINSSVGVKANIFTTNLTEGGLYKAIGQRLASRVCEMSEDISFAGKDKRSYFKAKEDKH